MLLAGTSRDGFRPRTPDHTNNKAVAITANATIQKREIKWNAKTHRQQAKRC